MQTSALTDHRDRVVEAELVARMASIGAVLIDGPKAVGKTVWLLAGEDPRDEPSISQFPV